MCACSSSIVSEVMVPPIRSCPPIRIGFVLFAISWLTASAWLSRAAADETAPEADSARSQAAFVEVARVLRHARCINCHTFTEFPLQGDPGKRHAMNVRRGNDNRGGGAMKCSTCHKEANQANGVPGAPHWGLAPLSMGWEGLDDHQLAESIKDTARNGGRTLEQLYEHMTRDALVLWAWKPGGKRQPPPMSQEEFAKHLRAWIDTGAISPDPVVSSPIPNP